MPDVSEVARHVAAYLPVTLTRRLLEGSRIEPGRSRQLMAAALFADMSGFTAMSEQLASDGARGAEELNRVLLSTFTGMIEVVHSMGGAVAHFHGDAMSIYFPDDDGRSAMRALACSQLMQKRMRTHFAQVTPNRPPGKNPLFNLTMKIGAGYGSCHELIVGEVANNLEFVLMGTAIEEAAAAEKRAEVGEIMVSRSILRQVGLNADTSFGHLENELPVPDSRPILRWEAYGEDVLEQICKIAPAFIPGALNVRLFEDGPVNLAEHRPVTSIFVQFDFAEGVQGDADSQSALTDKWWQEYYEWASNLVNRFASRNGRVNRILTADKGNQLHIILGAPVAPDATEQAILLALALQRERPVFVVNQRIGLSAGKVFAGPVGSLERREYTIVGDVVNLSARLSQLSENGTVLTDEVTAARVAHLVDSQALRPVQLKGKQSYITPYHVQRERAGGEKLQVYYGVWDKPMVGRDEELGQLRKGLEKALAGSAGAAVLSGATGTGKTQLVASGVKFWVERGGIGLMGEGQPHTNDVPYGPWRQIWQDFFDLRPGIDAHSQAAAVVRQTQAIVPDCAGDVALWGEVLGLPITQPSELSELSAEARQARFFHLARRCLEEAVTRQPLLIIMEGLHWADPSTMALLDYVAASAEKSSLFLLLAFRPIQDLSLDLFKMPSSISIVLTDLPSQDARKMLRNLVGTTHLPTEVERFLGLRDREGLDSPVNPMFLEESLNVLQALGILQVVDRGHAGHTLRVQEGMITKLQVPDTIHGLILARLDRLPPKERDLLQVASVIGRQFALEPLASITEAGKQDDLINEMAVLSIGEMTRIVSGAPNWVYLFQHAMTHEVAYATLPFARRQRLHAALAKWLVQQHGENIRPHYPVLAYHYSRAGNHQEGLRCAMAAANDAREIFANAEAIQMYRLAEEHLTALGEDEHWQTAFELFLSRAESHRFMGDFIAAVNDAERALHFAQAHDDINRCIKAYNLLADFRYRQSRFEEVLTLTERVIDVFGPNAAPDDRARALYWRGMAAAGMLDFDLALASLEQSRQVFTKTTNRKREALALEGIAFVQFSQGDLESSLLSMQRSLELSRRFSTPVNVAFAMSNIGVVQMALGRPFEAIETYDQTITKARSTSANALAFALSNRAEALAYVGSFPEARGDLEEATSLLLGMDDEYGLIGTYLFWGYEYSSALEDWEDARARLEQAKEWIDARPDSFPEERVRALVGLGQVELRTGHWEPARALLQTAEAEIDEKEIAWWRPANSYFLGLLHSSIGEDEKARRYFELGLKSIDRQGCPDYLPLNLLGLAKLETDETRRKRYLKACVEAAQNRARFVDKRLCLKEAGEMLLRFSEPELIQLGRECFEHL